MTRSIVVVFVSCVVLGWCLRAWRDLPSREFPRDGEHAPRPINENRSRR